MNYRALLFGFLGLGFVLIGLSSCGAAPNASLTSAAGQLKCFGLEGTYTAPGATLSFTSTGTTFCTVYATQRCGGSGTFGHQNGDGTYQVVSNFSLFNGVPLHSECPAVQLGQTAQCRFDYDGLNVTMDCGAGRFSYARQ